MNQDYEDCRQNGGAVSWTFISIVVLIVILCMLFGCTFNRNATLLESNITANGNTVPVSAVP